MSPDEIANSHHKTFEEIRHTEGNGDEYWLARELGLILQYQDWRNFIQVIEKAKASCENSGHSSANHFGDITKMVALGSGSKRAVQDIYLTRYACYLIVQNGDPSKPVIANGQAYFAIQTRRQEIGDEQTLTGLTEDQRRLMLRGEMVHHNKSLASAAKNDLTPLGMPRISSDSVLSGFPILRLFCIPPGSYRQGSCAGPGCRNPGAS